MKVGITDSPTCIDCHGEHLILSPEQPEASTYARRLSASVEGYLGLTMDEPERAVGQNDAVIDIVKADRKPLPYE